MNSNMKKIINKEKFKLSFMLFQYLFAVCLFFNIFKFFKILNCLVITEVISCIIPLIFYLITSKNNRLNKKIFSISIYIIIILILPFFFGKIYDTTMDGNSYHKTAIGLIKDGWNPIYESSKNFNSKTVGKIENIDIWIDHYPKASYFIASTMYALTNNIESGKCITLIANISLILLFLSIFEDKYNKKITYILGILIGLNPIVLSQIFSYYIDGLMGICFGIELLLLSIINCEEKKFNIIWVYLLCCCSIFVNLKFTGLLYSGMIAAIYFFYWIIKFKKKKNYWKIYKNFTCNFIIVFVVAIGFIGASSYVKNFVEHKNPLYPLIGKDKVDIITTMQPINYQGKSNLYKFINSLFSQTDNITYNTTETKLKNPFSISKMELENLYLPDVRIAGFGPLFAATLVIIILSIITSFSYLIKYKKSANVILALISIVLSVILVGENWWARYIPQLYYIVIISIFVLYNLYRSKNKMYLKIFSIIISVLIFINSLMFIYAKKYSINEYKQINKEMAELKLKEIEIFIDTSGLYGVLYNLSDKNINFTINNNLSEDEITYYYSWKLKVKR